MTQQLEECNPVDITVYRSANHMSDNGNPKTVAETLKSIGIDPEECFSEYIEVPVYVTEELTFGKGVGDEQKKSRPSCCHNTRIPDKQMVRKTFGHCTLSYLHHSADELLIRQDKTAQTYPHERS